MYDDLERAGGPIGRQFEKKTLRQLANAGTLKNRIALLVKVSADTPRLKVARVHAVPRLMAHSHLKIPLSPPTGSDRFTFLTFTFTFVATQLGRADHR